MLCVCVCLYIFSMWFEAEIAPVQGFKKWFPSTPEAAVLPAVLSSSCCPHLWIRCPGLVWAGGSRWGCAVLGCVTLAKLELSSCAFC